MRNDFFKYILLNGGSQADKKELESETIPFTFKSNGHRLRNYRIYGAEGGVGNLDSETGKYIIPLEINGDSKNISLDEPLGENEYVDFREQKNSDGDIVLMPAIPTVVAVGDVAKIQIGTTVQPSQITLDGNNNLAIYGNTSGVGDKTANLYDKSSDHKQERKFWKPDGTLTNMSTYYGSPMIDVIPGMILNRSYTTTSSNYFLSSDLSTITTISNLGNQNDGVTLTVPEGCTKFVFNIPVAISNDTIYVVEGSTPPEIYEPYGYKIPVTAQEKTTNIYLDSPLQKSGDDTDYIDYATMKRYNVDGTSKNIELPNIPEVSGINILSVDTTVSPSRVYLQGNIEKVTVSASLQLNRVQNLQTLQLANLDNIMLDVMPIEKPVLNSNEIGGDESAE